MASIEPYEVAKGRNKRERLRYRVIYRRPDGKQTSKSGFTTKRDAEDFVNSVEVSKNRGEYINPRDGRKLFGEFAQQWISNKQATTKPSTYQTYLSRWNTHVKPRWENVPVSKVGVNEVQTWITQLHIGDQSSKPPRRPLSASLVADCLTILIGVMDYAENDKSILVNPLRGKIKLPAKHHRAKVYLSHEQVKKLAEASAHPEIIYTLAYTGMRWGELTGLRVKNIDFSNRRIQIDSSITTLRDGTIHEGSPKNGERRTLIFPEILRPYLEQRCSRKQGEDFVFTSPSGGVLRPPSSQTGWFDMALKKAELPKMSPHDLRHTTASLAVSAGANVKALQRMLGHSSAAMTLDKYADLFDEDLVSVADSLDSAFSAMNRALAET